MANKKIRSHLHLPIEKISQSILLIRGQKVMLDADLAHLYGVTTKRLNEQVKRNPLRFPEDFTFQLSREEHKSLRSHFATSKGRGGRRYMPYVFTEHGALMAASVLNTVQAIEISVYVVRAFVRLRELLASNKALAKKLDQLERKLTTHDRAIMEIVQTIREMMAPDPKRKRSIGFAPWPDEKSEGQNP